jgi:MFS family permease
VNIAATPLSDRRLIYAAAFLRATAVGMIGVLAGLYLTRLHLPVAEMGLVVGAGLAGNALATAWAMADRRLGARRLLVLLAVLGALGGVAFSFASHPAALGLVAFLGMLNGMGRDRGPALVLEQTLLPSTTTDAGRTQAMAFHSLALDIGHALGALLAGLPTLLARLHLGGGVGGSMGGELGGMRVSLWVYAALLLAGAFVYPRLSPAIEPPPPHERAALSPESRAVVWKICALFGLDGVGGGFLTSALLSYFFFERFGVGPGTVGALFFAARLLNALSHLLAAWLARRIGLVNTMVFTHLPSSLLLVTVGFAPNFAVAAVLFLLREGLVEMDVPTRSSYVAAVVRPEERAFANGATLLVRLGAWAVAPAFAGLLMQGRSLAVPLVVAAAMKIAYDLLLYAAFRGLKPPEERTG